MRRNPFISTNPKRSRINSVFKETPIVTEQVSIAELLNERLKHERQVIAVDDITYVIDIMGQPNAFKMDSEEIDEEDKTTHKRKLFRDPDDKIFSGVAAGVAHYFRLKVKWVRLIWLLLGLFSWGGFVIIYLILWIVLSEAKTAVEKLMMRGEPINVSNLEKKIVDLSLNFDTGSTK